MYIKLRSVGVSPKRNLVYLEEINGKFRSILVKNAFSLIWKNSKEQKSMFNYWEDYLERNIGKGKNLVKVIIERDKKLNFFARVIWTNDKKESVEILEPWIAVIKASHLKKPILIEEGLLDLCKMSSAELQQNAIETVDEMTWESACYRLFNDLGIFSLEDLYTLLQSTIRKEDTYGYVKVIEEFSKRLGTTIS